MNIKHILNKPKVISVCADVNQGKTMLLYNIISKAQKQHKFNLFYYGLRINIKKAIQIYSVAEMENIKNSVIIVDELSSLFDLDNRKSKRAIENTFRLINHNNNILILCGVPENFKKFVSAKINEYFYKKSTIADFINGSTMKNTLLSYNGYERGTELLNMDIDKVLYYDGVHYSIYDVKYLKKYDTKKDNVDILQVKKCAKSVRKNV